MPKGAPAKAGMPRRVDIGYPLAAGSAEGQRSPVGAPPQGSPPSPAAPGRAQPGRPRHGATRAGTGGLHAIPGPRSAGHPGRPATNINEIATVSGAGPRVWTSFAEPVVYPPFHHGRSSCVVCGLQSLPPDTAMFWMKKRWAMKNTRSTGKIMSYQSSVILTHCTVVCPRRGSCNAQDRGCLGNQHRIRLSPRQRPDEQPTGSREYRIRYQSKGFWGACPCRCSRAWSRAISSSAFRARAASWFARKASWFARTASCSRAASAFRARAAS